MLRNLRFRADQIALVAFVLSLIIPWPAYAQAPDAGHDRSPRFFLVASPKAVPVEFSSAPILRRRITTTMEQVTLAEALATIALQAGIRLNYSENVVPVSRRVSFSAQSMTLAAVLTEVLLDTGLDVMFLPNGLAELVPRLTVRVVAPKGSIRGRVTDARTGAPIVGAMVQVVGHSWRTMADQEGRYRIADMDPDEYLVLVRRLGFTPGQQRVTVTGGGETITNFLLTMVPTSLTEVVTTATGERSRVEVGNAIGTIKADSLVPTTLIRNMSDLLTARTPGVVVQNTTSLVGAPSKIRIRGISSMQLNNDPIVIVDGVRLLAQTSPASDQMNVGRANVQTPANGSFSGENAPSRLDDIDPNTIESIDVLRGPSAATLYGTEAAKGVIVIKTKKGSAGPFRYTLLADNGWSGVPGPMPLQWFGWGHALTGGIMSERGDVGAALKSNCILFVAGLSPAPNVADGTCMQDSVVAFDYESDPQMRTLGTGTARTLSGSMSGGTEQQKEFLSLRFSDNVGIAKLSAVEQRRITQTWGGTLPPWVLHPNTEQDFSGSSRTNLRAASNLDVSLGINAVYRNVLNGDAAQVFTTSTVGQATGISSLRDTLIYLPAENMKGRIANLTKRGFINATANYAPMSWLALHGTLGGDYALRADDDIVRPTDCTTVLAASTGCQSSHLNERGETFVTTMDVGAQATFALLPWLTSRTAIGEQYSHTTFYALGAGNPFGTNLAFGSLLLTPTPVLTTGTQQFTVTEQRDEAATAGWYFEQTAAIRERLFLTAAFREDAASAFGSSVNAKLPIYPKVSLSWLLSDETFFPWKSVISSFRLRTAYGHSGTQARQNDVLANYAQKNAIAGDGTTISGVILSQVANPNLRPERVAEWEGGFDASLFDNERVHVEATVYRKLSSDAIISVTLAPSYGGNDQFGAGSMAQRQNVGSVENRGVELAMNAKLLDSRRFGWDLTVNMAQNANKLIHLNPGSTALTGTNSSLNRVGYPVFGYWGFQVRSYGDANGDGVLAYKEVAFSDATVFFGAGYPKSEFTYINSFTVLNGALRVNANFDQVNGLSNRLTVGPTFPWSAQAFVDRSGSLAQQAVGMQALQNGAFIDQASSVRFSELSMTYVLPHTIAHRVLQSQSASVTFAGRNLALWTTYRGKDPNVDTNFGTSDAPGDNGEVNQQPRNWTLRLNLHW